MANVFNDWIKCRYDLIELVAKITNVSDAKARKKNNVTAVCVWCLGKKVLGDRVRNQLP